VGTPYVEIFIGLSVTVGGAIVIFTGKLIITLIMNIKAFIRKITDAMMKIDLISGEIECRKRETQLLFKSQLIQLDIMSGTKINGQVNELRREIEEFNIYKEKKDG
jgi:hypothetical protein